MLAPSMALLWHAATSVALGCSTDYDCSLNGVCTSSVCVCDDGWRGVTCGQLNLLAPAAISPAYVPLNSTSWGGSVVRGPQRNYHMFVAEMGISHHQRFSIIFFRDVSEV